MSLLTPFLNMVVRIYRLKSFVRIYRLFSVSRRLPAVTTLAISLIGSSGLAQESTEFRVFFRTNDSISIWDPESGGDENRFKYTKNADGSLRHEIVIDQPLRYRDCTLEYRLSREIRVRWQPPEDFSTRALKYYEIVLTIIEPTDRERESVEIDLIGPEGFTQSHLQEYEAKKEGQGLESARLFFPAAFLAQHFSAALPAGHGLTRRMANASIDHLTIANKFLSNINLQPGYPFEEFTVSTVGGDDRGEKTISSLQGMNVSFFRDIFVALRDMDPSGDYEKCMRGLAVLKELSQCHDTIAISEPELLADAMGVVNSHIPEAPQNGFNFATNIADSAKTCEDLKRN